jgi:nicotinate-nucleotide pyrophosphorylase (carboxylating)
MFNEAERTNALQLIDLALQEDFGGAGDVTSLSTIPASRMGGGVFIVRTPGVVAGLPILPLVAAKISPELVVKLISADGVHHDRGDRLARMHGPLRAVLGAERTALNFLQRLSGIASLTAKYVEAIKGFPAQVLDTRKTTPGWRRLEKYAVWQGGGTNHRIGLYDGVLIKDNHLAGFPDPATAVREAIRAARLNPITQGIPIEVEVDTLEQFDQALAAKPAIILLDNMTNDQLREAVRRRNLSDKSIQLEASGGVNLTTIRGIAETGVDRISVGALTHSAPALDIALDYDPS